MQSKRLDLERIAPRWSEDSLDDVLVIFVATKPKVGGQRVVGWYKRATVYRTAQSFPLPDKANFRYRASCVATEAVLLPLSGRERRVPVGKDAFGQTNVCYSHHPDGKSKRVPWLDGILKFVDAYRGPNLLV